jgi:hypothetical protein
MVVKRARSRSTAAQLRMGRRADYNQARGPGSALPEALFLDRHEARGRSCNAPGLIQSPGEEVRRLTSNRRHLIDMLGMPDQNSRRPHWREENLIENILADLRMQFVAISKRR